MLGVWDQAPFRQTVVHGYRGPIRWGRPLYNGWSALTGAACLPAPGATFRHLMAAVPIAADDDAAVFGALLDFAIVESMNRDSDYLLLGLHAADPLLKIAKDRAATCYTTRLYLVCWEDGEPFRAAIDGRPPYLELGSL